MQHKPAGLLLRFLALIIDGFIIAVPLVVASVLIWDFDTFINEEPTYGSALLGLAIMAGYEVWLVASRGQTLGMQLLGLRVSSSGDVPAPVSLQASVIRYCVKNLQPIAFALTFISWFYAAETLYTIALAFSIHFHAQKRGWHDQLSGTYMLEEVKPLLSANAPVESTETTETS